MCLHMVFFNLSYLLYANFEFCKLLPLITFWKFGTIHTFILPSSLSCLQLNFRSLSCSRGLWASFLFNSVCLSIFSGWLVSLILSLSSLTFSSVLFVWPLNEFILISIFISSKYFYLVNFYSFSFSDSCLFICLMYVFLLCLEQLLLLLLSLC